MRRDKKTNRTNDTGSRIASIKKAQTMDFAMQETSHLADKISQRFSDEIAYNEQLEEEKLIWRKK